MKQERAVPSGAPIAARHVALTIALATWLTTGDPSLANAAFELHDASPGALGAVSTDLDPEPMFEPSPRYGWRLSASHAALFQVEGLTAEQASAAYAASPGIAELSLLQLGVPGEREDRTRIHLAERPSRGIAIDLTIERLDLLIEGEPASGGWTAGAGVRSRIPLGRFVAELALRADRLWRNSGSRAVGVEPSVPITIRLHSANASVAWIDRWESDGRHSPRLVVEIGLGGAARFRFGRGASPARTGAAFGTRLRHLEFLVGMLDESMAGSISGASIGVLL